MKRIFLLLILCFSFSSAFAYPGRTDSSGGHTCRTNCAKYGLQDGEYHYHNSGNSSSSSESYSNPYSTSDSKVYSNDFFLSLIKETGKCSSLVNESYDGFVQCTKLLKDQIFTEDEIVNILDKKGDCVFFKDLPNEKLVCNTIEAKRIEENSKTKAFKFQDSTKPKSDSKKEKKNVDVKKTYSVSSVVDGDTISVKIGTKTVKIRLIGINTPEIGTHAECYGVDSLNRLKTLIKGKKVSLEYDESTGEFDVYGRTLAYIFLDGENINKKMISEGYAFEYTYHGVSYKYQNDFLVAQSEAKNSKLGLWNEATCNGELKESSKNVDTKKVTGDTGVLNTNNGGTTQNKSYSDRVYIRGPKGGCYYINKNGNKTYVDRNKCD